MPSGHDMPTEMSGSPQERAERVSGPIPGRPWGRFLIEKRLGGGGQADVYQAFDQVGMAGHVALKVPRSEVPRERMQEWVETEAGPVVKLNHPNVVRVLDCGTVGPYPYVATELVHGLPLNEHVRANPPSLKQILDWMIQLSEALHAAHSRGIIHRDIKPLNIIITPGAVPRIIDFGLASFVTAYSPEPRRDLAGTYPFMAPEQARGDPAADHRVDVFAMGGILKYLLAGEGPYHGRDSAVAAARAGDVAYLADSGGGPLRRALRRIANRALAVDPDERYPTMEEMGKALRRLRSGPKVLLWALGALCLAAILGGVVWQVAGRSTEAPPPRGRGGPAAASPTQSRKARLSVEVRPRPGAPHTMLTADQLPLDPGAEVCLRAAFGKPMAAGVFLVAPGGDSRLLYPAEGAEPPLVTSLRVPEAENSWLDLESARGTVTVLLIAAEDTFPTGPEMLKRLLPVLSPPSVTGGGMLEFDGKDVITHSSTRWQRQTGRRTLFDNGFLGMLAERHRPEGGPVVRAIAFPVRDEGVSADRRRGLPSRRSLRRPGIGTERPARSTE